MYSRNDSAYSAMNERTKAAQKLEEYLKFDKTQLIEGELIYKQNLNDFLQRQGLTESLKVGDLVVVQQDQNLLIKTVEKHFNKKSQPVRGAKQVREIQAITKGCLHTTPRLESKLAKKDRYKRSSNMFSRRAQSLMPKDESMMRLQDQSIQRDTSNYSLVSLPLLSPRSPRPEAEKSLNKSKLSLQTESHKEILRGICSQQNLVDEQNKLPLSPHFMPSVISTNRYGKVEVANDQQFQEV